jgi:hypothetical protein
MQNPEIQSDLIDSLETESIIEHLQAERDYDDATRPCDCMEASCVECHETAMEREEAAHYAKRDCERGESDDNAFGDDDEE